MAQSAVWQGPGGIDVPAEMLEPLERPAAGGARVTPLDDFLSGIERRALVMAELATRDREEALDLVQDAMLAFVDRYAGHDPAEWPPLFHRVLQNRIRDWHRRQKVRRRWRVWSGFSWSRSGRWRRRSACRRVCCRGRAGRRGGSGRFGSRSASWRGWPCSSRALCSWSSPWCNGGALTSAPS